MIFQALTEEVELEQESYPVCCINLTGNEAVDRLDEPQVEDAYKAFIEYSKGLGRSQQTIERHHACLSLVKKYLDERGDHALASLTPQVMAGFQAWLYQAKSRYGRPYELQSQIMLLNSVQVFGRYLLTAGKLLYDPAESMTLPREPKRLPGTFLTSAEMKKLIAQPDTSTVLGFRDRTIYEVLYSAGLRVNELAGIRVQDIDFTHATIFIPQNKNYQDRYVPLGETARKYLTEYLDRVRPHLVRRKGEALVFIGRHGGKLDVTGMQLKLRIYAQRAGIKKYLTIHVFRHTLATEMLRRGADLRQIQELLGHKNLTTTQIYTHVVKGELRRVQAHCHPREQTDLPENFVRYRGRNWTRNGEK